MKRHRMLGRSRQSGFSLIELMLVIAILGIVIAAVFSQLSTAQQRLSTEETRLDDFQQARDFVDQFFRDINQIGTPNVRMFDTTQTTFSPSLTVQTTNTWANQYINDNRFAMGLTEIGPQELHFEGSVNGDGTVQSIIYKINGSGSCQYCMQRSQSDKTTGDPLTTAAANANWGTEVNDIISVTIFKYYQYDGTDLSTLATLPIDYTNATNAGYLANVKTIQINLTIRNNAVMDKQTGLPIETSFEGEVSLNNCSMAASSQNLSCE